VPPVEPPVEARVRFVPYVAVVVVMVMAVCAAFAKVKVKFELVALL
jgi:hypothetical protein